MNFLSRERETLERFLPGLDAELANLTLDETEVPGNPALELFREYGGTALLVPKEYGGLEATPLDMVQIQRALGSRSPSMALATNMHSCTVAAVPPCPATGQLLQAIVRDRLYLASGFGDGEPRKSILKPNMEIERVQGGWQLSGRKKPVSLSESMDLLTASVLLPSPAGDGVELALVTVPADAEGITVKRYGNDQILGGAENYEVTLNRVSVSDDHISYFGGPDELNAALSKAFLWFEGFATASYLGAASLLVERVIEKKRGSAGDRLALAIDLESQMKAIEGLASAIMRGEDDDKAVADAFFVRYSGQKAIERVTQHATELLGGVAYLESTENSSILASCRALAFHPPSRFSMIDALDEYLQGNPLVVP